MKSYIIRYKTSKTSTSIKSMIVEANDPIEAKEMVESYGMYVISCLKGEWNENNFTYIKYITYT